MNRKLSPAGTNGPTHAHARDMLALQEVAIADLRPWERNPRTISKTAFDRLKRSMQDEPDMLKARPVIALPDGTVVAGNMRLRAAMDLGWATIPTVYADLDERRAAEWALRDNNGFGEWQEDQLAEIIYELSQQGTDLGLLGFEDKTVQQLLDSVGAGSTSDEAAVPEVPANPITKPGDLWLLGPHRLLCGDSTKREDVDRLMAGKKSVLLLMDPPYGMNLDTDYSAMPKTRHSFPRIIGDDKPFDASLIRTAFTDVREQYWFGADYYASTLGDTEHGGAWLVWDKRVEDRYDDGFGSAFELVWSARRRRRSILRFQWFQNHADDPAEASSRKHPTQKPTSMLGALIADSSERGGLVLDLFGGSGSTLIAAHNLGRIACLMEIDPGYCDVICQRFRQATGIEPTLEAQA